jgi:hypothetical protein
MVRSVAKKVMWLGRATVFLMGLALMLALVFGMASTALGANGGNFILGSLNNTATAITKLTGTVGGGPALQVSNPSTATGSTALDLQVATGKAPMKVNRTTKVTNLNSDLLDGKDSRTFGTFMATSQSITGTCTSAGIWKGCASYTLKVPAGKVYRVTVWSSVNAQSADSDGTLLYCPAIQGGSFGLSCITPAVSSGRFDTLTLPSGVAVSGASSGEISLPAGSYNISTAINPSVALASSPDFNMHTTLMIQDSSVPLPPTE